MKVCILGCAKLKEKHPTKAIDLYMPSTYYRYARWYVENIIKPDKIYIFTSYPNVDNFSLQAKYINDYLRENKDKEQGHFKIDEQVTYFIDADKVIQPYGFGTRYPNYSNSRFNKLLQPVIDREFYELGLDKVDEIHLVGNRTYEKMLKPLRPDLIYHLADTKGTGHRISVLKEMKKQYEEKILY